jgi:hypothetical protein
LPLSELVGGIPLPSSTIVLRSAFLNLSSCPADHVRRLSGRRYALGEVQFHGKTFLKTILLNFHSVPEHPAVFCSAFDLEAKQGFGSAKSTTAFCKGECGEREWAAKREYAICFKSVLPHTRCNSQFCETNSIR